MAHPTQTIEAPTSPLATVLQALRLTGTLYCQAELRAPWGIDVPDLDGQLVIIIVTSGVAHLTIENQIRELRPGSLTLIPHGCPHTITSGGDAALTPLADLPVEALSELYERVKFGGDGALTRVTYGIVRFDEMAAHYLLRSLPDLVEVDSWSEEAATWLRSSLQLITEEARAPQPGSETIITRLADILVIQAIRGWLSSGPFETTGWLAALRDPRLGRALAAIHADPGNGWTLQRLADHAGMSRSAFSAAFSAIMGESAMKYVMRCRLDRSRADILASTDPLSRIAERHGYSSDATFNRAFKSMFGVSPGNLRRKSAID